MRCEVCGCRIGGKPADVIIEGARLMVCSECAKHGKACFDMPRPKSIFSKPRTFRPVPRVQTKAPQPPPVDASVELAGDYGTRIRKARENLSLSHEELGKKLNEKVSLLRKIETGRMTPSDKLAAALEHVLKVRLIVPTKEESIPEAKIPKKPSRELTLGDLMRVSNKGKSKEDNAERKQ